jgi:FkbM family methyltransferase
MIMSQIQRMLPQGMNNFLLGTRYLFKSDQDHFFKKASGVIHVGANIGQERKLYDKYGLDVLWIEPIPEVFETLQANLLDFPRQRALKCLVTDQDNQEHQFHIANNNGLSSSILNLNLHQDIWQQVSYEKTITLQSKTLVSLLQEEQIDPTLYDVLVMDTQGSELLVLKGAIPILKNFTYIKTEVADFESYKDCCQLADITAFLENYGYQQLSIMKFAEHPHGGSYYDVVYQRKA